MISDKLNLDTMLSENDNKKVGKSRVGTVISTATKTRWDAFLLAHHDTIRGEYGPELERAMNYYMDNFNSTGQDDTSKKINKSTLNTLKVISRGFRDLPTFPLIKPVIIKATIKNHCQYSDSRTVSKYHRMVLQHSQEVMIPQDMFPQWNIEGFCNYVDRLSNESHLK